MRRFKLKKRPPISYIHFSLLVFLCIFSYTFPGRLTIDIFLLVLGSCIADGIYFFMTRKYLRIDVNGGMPVEKNEIFTLDIKVTNKAYLPSPLFGVKPKETYWLKLTEKGGTEILMAPRETIKYKIQYRTQLSGESFGGIECGTITSFLGFFKIKIPLEMYIKIRILPEIHGIKGIDDFKAVVIGTQDNEKCGSTQCERKNGEEVGYELRPYVEGDSERLIHWKIAAYRDIYLVRQRESSIEQKTDIFMILNPLQDGRDEKESAILQDKIMTSFISMAYHFVQQGQVISLACYLQKEWKYIKVQTVNEIRAVQELLSSYHAVKTEKIDEKMFIKNLAKVCHGYGGVRILMSSYWNEEMQKIVLREQKKGQSMTMIWTGRWPADQLFRQNGTSIWHITDNYELERASERKY